MTQRSNDIAELSDYTANALLNEMDRASGGASPAGLAQLLGGQSLSSGLDRDFYAREVAADLGSSPQRIKRARIRVRNQPVRPREADLRAYAQSVGVDLRDQAAAGAAWSRAWAEMVDNLCNRALHLIETTAGPVENSNPLELLGIVPPADERG